MRGLVIKSTGSSYIVRMDDGSDAECRIKGNFRIRGIRSTNPVAVGDYVEVLDDWITDVEERRNYIIRRSTNLSKESHILAANIDQVALIVTVNHPVTSTTFIDRFLATCEAYRVRAQIIFNKVDLLTEQELEHLAELRELYESIGYKTVELSAISLQPSVIMPLLEGQTTLLSGNSGVGKSTLLNALFGREMTRTGKISDAHDKGMHTTTFSEMYFLDNGRIIDTPGIKGFGTIDFEKEEVSHYFREIFETGRECRFGNCTHTHEPGCAVQEALIKGSIAISRYESYLSLLGDCDESKYR
ncbi:MAG: ribosome small subunit-dependent GTPase A [Paludibacteraceae bacterium]|nr:ribosome small subunit-dependent GTPase A [Paludibacteraceae bacterium]